MRSERKIPVRFFWLLGFAVLITIVICAIFNAKRIISPVPEEGAIKIIYLTPTPTILITQPPLQTESPGI